MANDNDLALTLVKQRLDMLPEATHKDEYLNARIDAARARLERMGIHLTDSMQDTMLLVDVTVFDYQSRDKQTGMPDWLRMAIRERFLSDGRKEDGA